MINKTIAFSYLKNRVLLLIYFFTIFKAKNVFKKASREPSWLKAEMLEGLQQKYSDQAKYHDLGVKKFQNNNNKTYRHQEDLNQQKKQQQVARWIAPVMHSCLKKFQTPHNILEVGCGSGLTSYFLKNENNKITAIDLETKRFSKKVTDEKVIQCLQMDANSLQFEEEHFDFLFSFNTFEHFANPEKVLQEMIRVIKTGGYIYLVFNPLYMSPWGLHAEPIISVPYCQLLFSKGTLENFTVVHNLPLINFAQLNGWSLAQYRELFRKYSNQLKRVSYVEIYDPRHVDLIINYPTCFTSKTDHFRELIISGIVVLFQKKKA